MSVTKPVFQNDGFHAGFNRSEYRALVDTGAQRSVVSRSVIQEQQLVRIGHMQFAGLHGARTHSRYLAIIGLWVHRIDRHDPPDTYSHAERSLFNLDETVEVVDMDDNLNFDLILGFDVLKQSTFRFDRNEQTFELQVSD